MTSPTQHSSVGDLQITLTRAGRTCTLAGADLAKLIDSPAAVIRLAALLYARGVEVECAVTKKKGTGRPGVEKTAQYLADRLDDTRSLAFYRLVSEHVPGEVVHESLARALDLPTAKVRRSRAAYFTSLVRPYLQGRLPNS